MQAMERPCLKACGDVHIGLSMIWGRGYRIPGS